ncbi:response regulator transcription factor [Streptosporangium sp. 'caverna']|uniref:response regulator transcription factor n=1 Tax=Streptosporangium sp. 'caverna' TaxID=2202249 RepID=UPI000D7E7FBE|nr:response regulator transcription factor [Streptosporangium sp. 'caverna']AWS43318.1 DNA-binding response regulator [Streptosporangium sp. 'caverna']
MAEILLIEDDVTIRTALTRGLRELGHVVSSSPTAFDGLRLAVRDRPDLVVLDLGLPDLDGAELLPMLRAVSRVPVIVATARDGDAEMVPILNSGADDYVVKPFSAAQLDARVRAVLRRMGDDDRSPDTSVTVAGLRLDPRSRDAVLDGVPLELTPREFDLLYFLATRTGEVVTKRELMTEVWQVPYGGADKTVDVHLSWLRRKLGETAQNPRYLLTVRGVGVKLVEPT